MDTVYRGLVESVQRRLLSVKAAFKIRFEYLGNMFTLIPTLQYQRKKYAINSLYIVDITWLFFHLCIGEWRNK